MKKRLIALAAYSVFWLVFFFFARLWFILSQHELSYSNSLSDLCMTFVHGLKLDISTTGYFMAVPTLLVLPWIWFDGGWYRKIIKLYTIFLVILSSVIVVSDSTLYAYWGFRMDYTPFLYLKTPAEAAASVTTLQAIGFFLKIIFISAIFLLFYKLFIERYLVNAGKVKSRLPLTLFFTLILGSLIIPVRGGFGIAPINAGSVYFSPKMFLNHCAVNAVWNVGTTAFTSKPVSNPYNFGDQEKAGKLVASLLEYQDGTVMHLNNQQANILLLVMESFSGYVTGPLGGDSLVTPNLNRYCNEGILFTNFYASGTRTDKAMPAILNGYPAQPAQSIIKEPKKSQSLPSIVRILSDKGYNSSFWYGGDINFANFNSFVIGSGFQNIITKDNFNPSDFNSKWGVHDHVLFTALRDSMKNVREPFFNAVLTLSSHEPFDVPMKTRFAGTDNITKYKNSVYYADSTLGVFIDWAKTCGWWKNTLVIIVADHCGRVSETQPAHSPMLFKIPMLWTGGAVKDRGLKIEKFGDQTDIAVTLMNQLGYSAAFPFGKDLFAENSHSYAFYTYNEGFGFLTDTSIYVYDHKLKSHLIMEGKGASYAETAGKSYLQTLFDDYLKR